jgi:hypothetical protein
MRTFSVMFVSFALFFSAAAVAMTWAFRDALFHPVEARCLSGSWEPGSSTRRGFAIIHLQYTWDNNVYDSARTFGPLDDSARSRQTLEDVQEGHNWIATNCQTQLAFVMYGVPSIAWFNDARSWNSVLAEIVLRTTFFSALFAALLTLCRYYKSKVGFTV